MMRRGFWLAAGAVLGVTGYRKATRLARTVTALAGQQAQPQLTSGPGGPGGRGTAATRPAGATGPAGATLRLAAGSATLLAGGGRRAAARWPARILAGTRSAAGFISDVREGMDDYRSLRGEKLGRSLGSQRDRAWTGPSPRGQREP
jgi:hypothetical protein